jgi:predicted RecB family nuclease
MAITVVTICDIINYIHCPYKFHLVRQDNTTELSDYEKLLSMQREATKKIVLEKAAKSCNESEMYQSVECTELTLRNAPSVLVDVTVLYSGISFILDGLVRTKGFSLSGTAYAPILIHGGYCIHKEQKLALAITALILADVQGALTCRGTIFYGPQASVSTISISGQIDDARCILKKIRRDLHEKPKLFLNSDCNSCRFHANCRKKAEDGDDICLIRGINTIELNRYRKKGILTISQLAYTFRPRKSKTHEDNFLQQRRQFALQARAIKDKKIYLFGATVLPETTNRIYLDIESLPDEGYCYLIGFNVCDGNTEQYFSFWAVSRDDEPRMLNEFISFMNGYEDYQIFSYGSFEKKNLSAIAKRSGRTSEIEKIVSKIVNVLQIIYSHVYFPTYSLSLKEVAGYFGFSWNCEDPSGANCIAWRKMWEAEQCESNKERILSYNNNDCIALKTVVDFLYGVIRNIEKGKDELSQKNVAQQAEGLVCEFKKTTWQRQEFASPDFAFINECAYFDYQREKVFVRTNAQIRKNLKKAGVHVNRLLRASKIETILPKKCVVCGSKELDSFRNGNKSGVPLPRYKRCFDLVFSPYGVRRRIIEYHASPHRCKKCNHVFVPENYTKLAIHSNGLSSWIISQHVEYHDGFRKISKVAQELFGMRILHVEMPSIRELMAMLHRPTYNAIMKKLLDSPVLHIDETEIKLRKSTGYVWVFTSLEEVVYIYKPSREGAFLDTLLERFRGVIVSDFFSAYDSLPFAQQKCLIHLMRDINQNLLSNAYDSELRSLTSRFGTLLREIVSTIDQHGLKRNYLKKHSKDIASFFNYVKDSNPVSEVARALRKKFIKYEGKLFTFTNYDNVPWNNNNAENAIKRFAYFREDRKSVMSEKGLESYLLLLSICETCRYKGVSFLRFLLSRSKDVDEFCRSPRKASRKKTYDLYPKDFIPDHLRRFRDVKQRKSAKSEECKE